MTAPLFVRVPQVHTARPAGPPLGCPERCLTCGRHRHACGLGQCAPICAKAAQPPGPVHVCLLMAHAAARLVVRASRPQTHYTGPTGNTYPPPPILWPLLVVDACPWCDAAHIHTIHTPGHRWLRRCPATRKPYFAVVRRSSR